jgi:biotin synthase
VTVRDLPILSHPAIDAALETLLDGQRTLTRAELATLATMSRDYVPALLGAANRLREHFCGSTAAVEVLFNAKRGGCSEDCGFCSQSARYASDVQAEPLRSVDEFVAAAHDAHRRGAGEFCMVVAVRGPSTKLLERVVEAVTRIKRELPKLIVAVSLGMLRKDQVDALVACGVDKVNHNLETSRRHFPAVCTTHTYDERVDTCRLVRDAGLELCCGGIVGMGETIDDRVDFLLQLRELDPTEVPINFLNPRPGTPFADQSLVEPIEALRFVALARFAMPRALIRFAGGREVTLQGLQDLGMLSGASGLVLGSYLTTGGQEDDADFAMLTRLGFEIAQ